MAKHRMGSYVSYVIVIKVWVVMVHIVPSWFPLKEPSCNSPPSLSYVMANDAKRTELYATLFESSDI